MLRSVRLFYPRARSLATIRYPGASNAPYTATLTLEHAEDTPVLQCFRLMNERGKLLAGATDYGAEVVGEPRAVSLLKKMLCLHEMDTTLLQAQRQGRIPFYMTTFGEEAAVIGSAASLRDNDPVFAQYREHGVLLYRGLGYDYFCNQCTGNAHDPAKARQMPMHFGSPEKKFHTVSSPLATQIPHAVGAAYALKLRGGQEVAAVFFGEGAASEGDFAAAVNFAAVLDLPVLFLCRNNGYAISTRCTEQYRGDGIARRGVGYGVTSLRVDGNDIWATMQAVAEARQFAMENNKPVLLELMTYRSSHHSTSDDSARYRSQDEMSMYAEAAGPIDRLRSYLVARGWWDLDEEKTFRDEERKKVVAALQEAEDAPKPEMESLFEDVYAVKPPHLIKQENTLRQSLRRK